MRHIASISLEEEKSWVNAKPNGIICPSTATFLMTFSAAVISYLQAPLTRHIVLPPQAGTSDRCYHTPSAHAC